MKFVEEIVVEELLPTVRSLLAEELEERELTQREIAQAIGVSQSAVSKYVHGDIDRNAEILTDKRVQTVVSDLADGLADGSMDNVTALIELEVLIRTMEAPGELLAAMHERAVPGLADRGPFRIHDPDSRMRQRERIRSSVRRAIRLIEETPLFVRLLPQVGANVVEMLRDGESVEDVAGVPGRIIDVEGRVEIPGDPQFGVSGHLAGILLAARTGGSDACGAINIRYSSSLVTDLRELGYRVVEIPGDADVPDSVQAKIRDAPETDVIAQTGGFGIEPVIYILASDAPAAVTTACRLVQDES